jgi:hypothetical protein
MVTVAKNVMLAYPHPGLVRAEFMNRVLALTNDEDSRIGEVADLYTGPAIGMARNTLAHQFLSSQMEWLWMVDTDMVFAPGTLPALLEHADSELRPVIGATCVILSGTQMKVSMYQASKDDDGNFGFRHIHEWPANTLLRVDGTGAACLLVHRTVFTRISEAKPEEHGLWFTGMIIDGHEIGEDLSFCLRCAMAEIPVHVHTGIEVGHMKALQLGNVRCPGDEAGPGPEDSGPADVEEGQAMTSVAVPS